MKVYDGYVRVSEEGGRGLNLQSPDDQSRLIRAWIDRHDGIELGAIEQDVDVKSQTKMWKRPGGKRIFERLEDGTVQGVVVAYFDRLTKQKPFEAFELFKRIEDAGAKFEAADLPEGSEKFRPLLAVINSMGWESTKERIERGERMAQSKGVNTGKPNFGYRKELDAGGKPKHSGRWEKDPATAPLVEEAFRMRATGRRGVVKEIQAYFEKEGHPKGESEIRYMLTSRSYRGEMALYVVDESDKRLRTDWITELPDGTNVSHPPLVDEKTWQKAQLPLAPNGKKKNTHDQFGIVTGLATCASCGHRVNEVAYTRPGLHGGSYKCQGKKRAVACPAPSVSSIKTVDEYLVAAINQAKVEGKLQTTTSKEEDLLRLKRERDHAQEALDRSFEDEEKALLINRYGGHDGTLRWRRLVKDKQEEFDTAEADVRTAEKSTTPLTLEPGWETRGTLDERRALVRSIIKKLTISQSSARGGARQPIAERIEITWAGTDKPDTTIAKKLPPIGGIELTKWFKDWQLLSKEALTKGEADALGMSRADLGNLRYNRKVARFENGKYKAVPRKDWPK